MRNTRVLNRRHGRKGSLGTFQALERCLRKGQCPKGDTLMQRRGKALRRRFILNPLIQSDDLFGNVLLLLKPALLAAGAFAFDHHGVL